VRPCVVGTAGHIDHGKTLLVKALTGVDADRWEEEKRRGITIDIGFAPLSADGATLHFVDLPGHERFIKNMLAGATGVDLFLLVVAADESVMPQTVEHGEILRLLGLRRGVVALNKIDLVDGETREMALLELGEFLGRLGFAGLPVVPVSARTGEGLGALRSALLSAAAEVPERPAGRPFRLPVDRVFPVKGFGTVVTGTVTDGALDLEGRVQLAPDGGESKVRGLQVFGAEVPRVRAGQRAALNLPDLHHTRLRRGQTAAAPGGLWPTYLLDVRLEVLASAPFPLRSEMTGLLHLHTQEVEAHLHLAGTRTLGPGESGLAQLRLTGRACAWPGDRFILRLPSPARTVAGGEVLLPARRKARWARPRDGAVADALRAGGPAAALEGLLLEAGPAGVRSAEVAARLGLAPGPMEEAAREAERSGVLVRWPGAEWWLHGHEAEAWLGRASAWLAARTAAGAAWVPRPEMTARWGRILEPRQADALAEALLASGRAEGEGDRLRPAGHRVQLDASQRAAWDAVLEDLAGAALSPLAGADLERTRGPAVRRVLPLLCEERRVVRFGGDFFLLPSQLEAIRGALAARAREAGPLLPIPEFKERLGISRRYAMPLLEYLDDLKWTRREGEGRRILL